MFGKKIICHKCGKKNKEKEILLTGVCKRCQEPLELENKINDGIDNLPTIATEGKEQPDVFFKAEGNELDETVRSIMSEFQGQTTVLDDSVNIDIPSEEIEEVPKKDNLNGYLVRKSSNEVIRLDKKEFIIGRQQNVTHYSMPEITKISRQHFMIIFEKGSYHIVDLKSSNNTFVNGVKLPPKIKFQLKEKDNILVPEEGFVFERGEICIS